MLTCSNQKFSVTETNTPEEPSCRSRDLGGMYPVRHVSRHVSTLPDADETSRPSTPFEYRRSKTAHLQLSGWTVVVRFNHSS